MIQHVQYALVHWHLFKSLSLKRVTKSEFAFISLLSMAVASGYMLSFVHMLLFTYCFVMCSNMITMQMNVLGISQTIDD